jgi:hypothetical protein
MNSIRSPTQIIDPGGHQISGSFKTDTGGGPSRVKTRIQTGYMPYKSNIQKINIK